jgi:hypothetical protein
VISTRPGPAGGTNRATEARPGALSNSSSHRAGLPASTACTAATGSPRSAAPSWAANSPNPAASTAASSAGNCHATATSASRRWAYSSATLVLPAPPSPHNAATRGPPLSYPASLASSSASRFSRPARNTGRGASRSARPAVGPADCSSRFACLSSTLWIPVLSPWIKPFRSLNSAARTAPATSARNAT